ncbi:hypothetical protein [Myxococcus landrumensis]|uniref:Uncharacterized protein n=1 Tax=Myxococcus landrumensis TaxID=2813577 RepID=A0ABX7N8P7_9BACT|nr:hypothetical protein [Myxococcus landrumus]QSQ14017.1 hypothetical protein JY572_37840 [Myxococcus landrumus]
MTKPWEQEWRAEGCSWVERRDDVTAVAQVQVSGSADEQAVYNRFLAAAPDMARELRHLVRLIEPLETEGGLNVPGLATLNGARRALRKAGVLPEDVRRTE